MGLIQAFGLNLKILLAQLVNFAILLFVLYRFAYKPIFSFLEERRKRIEKGVKDAEKAVIRLGEIEDERKKTMADAKKEACRLIEEAKELADKKRDDMINNAKDQIKTVIADEKKKIAAEKAETMRELKREVAGLVTLAVEQVVRERMDDLKDKSMVERVVKSLNGDISHKT